MFVCLCMFVFVFVFMFIFVFVCVCICVYICLCVRTCVGAYMYACNLVTNSSSSRSTGCILDGSGCGDVVGTSGVGQEKLPTGSEPGQWSARVVLILY